jgi:hypothetical protein
MALIAAFALARRPCGDRIFAAEEVFLHPLQGNSMAVLRGAALTPGDAQRHLPHLTITRPTTCTSQAPSIKSKKRSKLSSDGILPLQ